MSQVNEGTARAAAPDWLPESARSILLVGSSAGDDRGGTTAVEVAELVARHRPRTLLVNAVVGSAGPDGLLRPEGGSGLGDVVAGRCRVSEAAFTPSGRSFIVVPAGVSVPGLVELCRNPAFRHLVTAAGRGGTLLLHVTETDLAHLARQPTAIEGLSFDGLVMLGPAAVPRNLPPGLHVLARVEPQVPAPPSGRPEPSGGRSPGFGRPSRTPAIVAGGGARKRQRGQIEKWVEDLRRRGAPRGLGGVAAVWLVAVLAVWLVWQGLSGWPAFEDDFDSPIESPAVERPQGENDAAVATPPAELDAEPTESSESAGSSEGGPTEVVPAPEASRATGIDLPYSILVASVPTYDDAAAKRDDLEENGNLAFIAPTRVSGGLYYRVFVGALEDREGARDLMRRLVRDGDKERERDWDMRPTTLAFTLGDFESRDEAAAESQRLHESGLPAYVLAVGDSTGAIYRLFFGAYESEGAAAPADSILSAAGQTATLVTRRGEPR